MNRCAPFLAAVLALAALVPAWAQTTAPFVGPTLTPASPVTTTTTTTTITTTAASTPADGAIHRKFPQSALRGSIVFGAPPAIQLNGLTGNLAPGYRIHGVNNLIVMSAQLVDQQITVDYTTDVQGQVYEVWLLSPTEIANQPWPTTSAQAAAWTFNLVTQTWTKP